MYPRFIGLALSAAIWTSCANRVAPQGGPKDTAPPKLIASQPENFSHSFRGEELTLHFDEFIQLREADKQIIISPMPDEKPQFASEKKSLTVKFKKPLPANTTYTLSFGNAIADIHEGNVLDGFRFVFSTGSFLDSLSIEGTVADAFTLQPLSDISVMLYSGFDDSLPYRKQPEYLARTDASGRFRFENLSAASFKLFTLKDKNSNYLYDHPDEWIAPAYEPVQAGDSALHRLLLYRELPQQLKLLNVTVTEPVKVMLAFNKKAAAALQQKSGLPSWHSYSFNPAGDTMTVWMADTLKDSLNVYLVEGNRLFDSVSVSLKKTASLKQRASALQPLTVSLKTFVPGETISFKASHPVAEANTGLIKIISDSAAAAFQRVVSEDKLTWQTDFAVMPEKSYTLLMLPGALKDIYGRMNDTLRMPVQVLSEKETGSLSVQLNNESSHPLLVSLVNDKEQSIRDTIITVRNSAVAFTYLPPGVYRLKAIEDINQNGRWDTGHYLLKQRPERVTYFKEPVTIRANWDIENTWTPEFK